MTLAQLIGKTTIAIFLFSLWKVIFFGILDSSNTLLLAIYYLVAAIIAMAVVRRLGVLNYLEAFMIAFIWLVITMGIDFLLVGRVLDESLWRNWHFWLSYLVLIVATIALHKKRHVEIRKGRYED